LTMFCKMVDPQKRNCNVNKESNIKISRNLTKSRVGYNVFPPTDPPPHQTSGLLISASSPLRPLNYLRRESAS
jgi:hypothetical protein